MPSGCAIDLARWRTRLVGMVLATSIRRRGQGHPVTGEAGIGKSRLSPRLNNGWRAIPTLLRTFFHRSDRRSIASGDCGVAARTDITSGDTDAEQLAKLDALLAQTLIAADDIALIADMLSIPQRDRPLILDASPQTRKVRTFAALATRLRSLSRTIPYWSSSKTHTGPMRVQSSSSMPRYPH